MINSETSLREIAFLVCTALEEAGTRVVLTGGSAAEIWAALEYQSGDLDFIVQFSAEDGARPLRQLGFFEKSGSYEHPNSDLILEFPVGPLSVGDDLIQDWDTLTEDGRILHVLTPTDSCRDRLAGYLFWSDLGSLQEAVSVARCQPRRVDLAKIEDWCSREGHLERFHDFKLALGER